MAVADFLTYEKYEGQRQLDLSALDEDDEPAE